MGWATGSTYLISVIPGLVPMNPLTAVSFILAGVSLCSIAKQEGSPARIPARIAWACASIVAAAGMLRLVAFVPGWDAGIDQLMFREKLSGVAFGPNRMAPTTAAAFLLTGAALLLRNGRGRVSAAACQACALATGSIALFAITAYAYSTFSLSSSSSPTPMALHTAATFLLLTIGIVMATSPGLAANGATSADSAMGTKIAMGFTAALGLLAAVGMVAYRSASEAIDDGRRVAHSLRVIENLKDALSKVLEVEDGARGYVITGDEAFLPPYRNGTARLPIQLNNLAKMTADNPTQQTRLAALKPLVEQRLAHAVTIVELRKVQGFDAAAALVRTGEGRVLMNRVRELVLAMESDEHQLLTERQARATARGRQTLVTVVAGSALGLICVAVAGVMIRRDMIRRRQAEDHAAALNRMLELQNGQLDAANKELESFSYSVSHDLRAPLRSVDGFSQALIEDYSERLDADGREHLNRVRAATQRMGQLIDDMLNLSRVTRQEMRRERVDLSAMARAVAGELRKNQPERQVDFKVADGLVADADPRLMRVVLDNLIGNAWKFTGKSSHPVIEFGVSPQDGSV